jgi:phosphatidylserine decarboxylase
MYETGNAPVLAQGEELGRFNMGSTVIVLAQSTALQWQAGLASRTKVQMGQALGVLND